MPIDVKDEIKNRRRFFWVTTATVLMILTVFIWYSNLLSPSILVASYVFSILWLFYGSRLLGLDILIVSTETRKLIDEYKREDVKYNSYLRKLLATKEGGKDE